MIEIDGSLLEGGGQVLRMSVALSALLKKPIRIFNIRGNRAKPGLRAQHLSGLKLVHQLTGGQMEGCQLHSPEIIYKPDTQNNPQNNFEMDIGNNGAISLLVQICLPVALFRAKTTDFTLKGGTFGDFAPPMIYCQQVFVPILQKHFGLESTLQIIQESSDMKGGGHVNLQVRPLKTLQPLNLTQEEPITDILLTCNTTGKAPFKLASKASKAAQSILQQQHSNLTIQNEFLPEALGTALTLFIKAQTPNSILAASKISQKRSENPDHLGAKTAQELKETLDLGVPVDQWMQDQLIIYMALASGTSRLLTGPLTLHTRTAISIAEQLTSARFKVTLKEDKKFVIECQGIGFSAP